MRQGLGDSEGGWSKESEDETRAFQRGGRWEAPAILKGVYTEKRKLQVTQGRFFLDEDGLAAPPRRGEPTAKHEGGSCAAHASSFIILENNENNNMVCDVIS